MNTSIIINIFQTIYEYYIIKGDKFRARAYKNVIDKLQKYKTLNNINVSKKMRNKLDTLISTGTLNIYETIKHNTSYNDIKTLSSIYGFGPSKAHMLYKKDIKTFNLILSAINDVQLISKIDGLTHNQKIGIKYYNDLKQPLKRELITKYIKYIQRVLRPSKIQPAGSYYRGLKESNDIDIIIVRDNNININDIITKLNPVEILTKGKYKTSLLIKLKSDKYVRKIDIALVPENELLFYLLYFSVGAEESIKIRKHAHKQGYKLNEKGLYKNGIKIKHEFITINDILKYIKYID